MDDTQHVKPFVEEDNRPEPLVYLALVVAAFVLGVLIGWLLWL